MVAVRDYHVALRLEAREVVYDFRAEEDCAIIQRGFVDDDLGSLGLDALHDALDGAVTEIVGVGFHREAVHSDDGRSVEC